MSSCDGIAGRAGPVEAARCWPGYARDSGCSLPLVSPEGEQLPGRLPGHYLILGIVLCRVRIPAGAELLEGQDALALGS
jgi:hypothetical protein